MDNVDLDTPFDVAIIGSSGGIGSAFISLLLNKNVNRIFAFSRKKPSIINDKFIFHPMDITDEQSIIDAVGKLPENTCFKLILVCSGLLHSDNLKPEKNIESLNSANLQHYFLVNSIGPALVAKHFLPLLDKSKKAVLAALSARVGSISDNRLGGWYGYRASKAALNMIIKNLAIECKRLHPNTIIVGLHPGTVDTNLSKPFQANVAPEKLFTPEFAANALLDVIIKLTPQDSGFCFDWAGEEIAP